MTNKSLDDGHEVFVVPSPFKPRSRVDDDKGVPFGHDTNYMIVEGRGKDYVGFEEEVGLDAEVTNASPSRTVVVDESG